MHQHAPNAKTDTSRPALLLVGQPNVGKSVLFAALTGRYVTVSNYPGTTVEVMTGDASFDSRLEVIDTPGVGTLVPRSDDEEVAVRLLFADRPRRIVQVGDAKNLRRTLMMTFALAETGIPMVLALNMFDEAQEKGIVVDTARLAELLRIPVVPTVAVEKEGIQDLIAALRDAAVPQIDLRYNTRIEAAAKEIEEMVTTATSVDTRYLAMSMLAGGSHAIRFFDDTVAGLDDTSIHGKVEATQHTLDEPLILDISKTRSVLADRLTTEVTRLSGVRSEARRMLEALSWASTHPIVGLGVLAFVLYAIYQVVGVLAAGTAVDFLESVVFGEYLNPLFMRAASALPWPLLADFFVGEYGLLTMGLSYAFAIVFPIVTAFFLLFGILEDTGYLPRLAVMVDRIFKAIGLNGKAVLPMVLGLGCGTMATLTTRILDTRKERVIATLLLALGIPCSAQLGVILGLFGSLSATALALFTAVIAAQLLFVGWLASKLVRGPATPFLVEIPPFRLPKLSNLLRKTYYRVTWFVKEAVPIFLAATAFLWAASVTGLLGALTNLTRPIIVGALGLPPKATEAFILGFLRRDYGAAGLFSLFDRGLLDPVQVFVAMVTITLFVPCVAAFAVIIKERGLATALGIVGFIFPYAVLVGAAVNIALRTTGLMS